MVSLESFCRCCLGDRTLVLVFCLFAGCFLQQLSSLTRAATQTHCSRSWDSQPLDDQENSPNNLSFFFLFFFPTFLLLVFFFLIFMWLHQVLAVACWLFSCGTQAVSCSMQDLVPWPGIEPETLALGVWSLNSWTTRGVTHNDLLNCSPMDFCEVKQAMRTYQENDGRGMLTTNPTPTQVGMKTKQKQEKVLPAGYSWERPQEDCSLLLPFGTNWEFHEPVSSLWPQCSVIDCKWRQLWRFPHSESWGHGKASGRIRSTPVGAHWLIIDCQGTWCCKRFWSAKHMIVFLCYHFLSDWGSI